jgi:hypothetical protein
MQQAEDLKALVREKAIEALKEAKPTDEGD